MKIKKTVMVEQEVLEEVDMKVYEMDLDNFIEILADYQDSVRCKRGCAGCILHNVRLTLEDGKERSICNILSKYEDEIRDKLKESREQAL